MAEQSEKTAKPEYRTFREFWPFYLSEHANALNRWLHFCGSLTGLGIVGYSIYSQIYWLLPLSLVAGYAFAWVGHFGIEKNRPATFQYPLKSFIGDWKMFLLMATGQINKELRKLKIST